MEQVKRNKIDYSNQFIYIGIDVHKKQWKVSIYTEHNDYKTFTHEPVPALFVKKLQRDYPGGRYKAVYEAGFCGYWISKELNNYGVECMIVNPSDVPVKDKERRTKTDTVDSKKLAKSLRSGELEGIYIPDAEAISLRSLVRLRTGFVRKQTRCKNQIKSFLNYLGIELSEDKVQSYWSRAYIERLKNLEQPEEKNKIVLSSYLIELQNLRDMILNTTRAIRTASRESRYAENVRVLRSVPGIGELSSMILLSEIVDIHRFKDKDKLSNFIGIAPSEHSSGERRNVMGLTGRSNLYLRNMLIESAWVSIRKDPALAESFKEYIKRMPRNKAIIKICRKLINRIYYVLKTQKEYETGVV